MVLSEDGFRTVSGNMEILHPFERTRKGGQPERVCCCWNWYYCQSQYLAAIWSCSIPTQRLDPIGSRRSPSPYIYWHPLQWVTQSNTTQTSRRVGSGKGNVRQGSHQTWNAGRSNIVTTRFLKVVCKILQKVKFVPPEPLWCRVSRRLSARNQKLETPA